uniref:Uncharacterized protein n=1 Tax=viral metagenome TaxID=1070528 RepID=A0A6M3KYU0_9ZZZZ
MCADMEIINRYEDDNIVQIVIEIMIPPVGWDCIYPVETGVLPITPRWHAASNSLRNLLDISSDYSIMEIRAGFCRQKRYYQVQSFQFTYQLIKGEKNDS